MVKEKCTGTLALINDFIVFKQIKAEHDHNL